MSSSILICSSNHGGCGFIGHGQEEFGGHGDIVICPICLEDHAFQLTEENLDSYTDEENADLARKLILNEESVVGTANCGCVHHAEEGYMCVHDVATAREEHFSQ